MLRIVIATLLSAILFVPLVVSAGDDVDYSAPYLVVEDGELVTKYPAQEHAGDEALESPPAEVDTRKKWYIAGAVTIVVVAALIMIRRGRQRKQQAD